MRNILAVKLQRLKASGFPCFSSLSSSRQCFCTDREKFFYKRFIIGYPGIL